MLQSDEESLTNRDDDDSYVFAAADGEAPITTVPSESPPSGLKSTGLFILEPAVFLIFLAMYMSNAVYQNQILYQTCVVDFQFKEANCQPLLGVNKETTEAHEIEAKVQPLVANILMARSLLESIIPAVVNLFIGPWSDKFGRRPIILATFTGYFVSCLILCTLSFISKRVMLSGWIFLLSSVTSILSGGTSALITGVYCYISDVASEKNRAYRMVLNEACLSAGMMIGSLASGYIYAATNVFFVFSISATLAFLALIYVFVFVGESLPQEDIQTGSRIREFFRFDLVRDLVRTCTRRRPNYDRAIIWLTITSLTVIIFSMEGESNVTYLFVRQKFKWTLRDYTTFNAARIVVQIIGSITGMILLRRLLKVSIVGMEMISLACFTLENTVRATAMVWWEMYLGMALGFMRGILGPMARAILSHVAPATEVGKIYALTTTLESLSPLGAAPLYTNVYKTTLNSYPGAFNFISAALSLLCYSLNSIIYAIQKSYGSASTYKAIGS